MNLRFVALLSSAIFWLLMACTETTPIRTGNALPIKEFTDDQRGPGGTRLKTLPEDRVALVIGNNDYLFGNSLKNPINDARAMAVALRELNFKVTQVENANLTVMRNAVANFNRKLLANRKGVGLFYFAGHGIKSNSGLNYLIPVDFQLITKTELITTAIDAETILNGMEESNKALNIAILDACRNDPFATRSANEVGGSGGLAEMAAPGGSLVALATAPGSVASDGAGEHGIYTEVLLKYIRTPDMDIRKMFDQVGAEVAKATANQQRPWYHTSVTGDFKLLSTSISTNASSNASTPQTAANTFSIADWLPLPNIFRSISVDFAMFHDNGTTNPRQLKTGDTLHSSDGYFFHIKANAADNNYFYLFQVDSSGKLFRLFPSQKYHTIQNPVPANKRITLPNEREVFFLDNTLGTEDFYFLASDKQVDALEQLKTGTVDDILDADFPLRGPAGVKKKTDLVATPSGETTTETQEFSANGNLVHTISIKHD
jgi:hypothetical protein